MALSPSHQASPARPAKRPRITTNNHADLKVANDTDTDVALEQYVKCVNRSALDFDLPPICSVTLVTHNLYLCLVCGRLLNGRSPPSPAFAHAVHDTHHLFINLSTNTIHLLPDDRVVSHPALRDITLAYRPVFTRPLLPSLDTTLRTHTLPDGVSRRTPGAVALDALHFSPASILILHLFLRPAPIRNALLLLPHDDVAPASTPTAADAPLALPHILAAVCRAIWTPVSFRPHVSPHNFLHLLAHHPLAKPALKEKQMPDPALFLAFLLNAASAKQKKTHRKQQQQQASASPAASFAQLVRDTFSGRMTITTLDPAFDTPSEKSTSFWFLSLDLPPKPLFKHHVERDIVPQVSLDSLLQRYDGRTATPVASPPGTTRTLKLTHAPPFLFLILRRFTRSNFAVEKNPCVVHLPAEVLELDRLCDSPFGKYQLVGAVSHQGTLEKGRFRVAVFHQAAKAWFDVTDVAVEQTLFQLVSLADNYILLYARCDNVDDQDTTSS